MSTVSCSTMMGLFIKSAVVLMLVYSVFGIVIPASNNPEKKFRIFLEEKNWHESLLHCCSHNMTLATIVSQQEQDQVDQLIEQTASGYGRYWLGGADLFSDKNFIWFSTGKPFDYTNFRPGQPDHSHYDDGAEEHCLELNVGDIYDDYYNWNYEWNDSICEHSHYFICHYFE